MLFVIKYRKLFYIFALLLVGASLALLAFWRLNLGIDFTGGTLWEIQFAGERPTQRAVSEILLEQGLEASVIQPTDQSGYILRFRPLEEIQHQAGLAGLEAKFGEIKELRFDAIGPSIGKELRDKSIYAVVLAILATILYIAWAFRKVERVVSSWIYGCLTVVAMLHDVLIPLGVFAILGKFFNVEITGSFIAAILTVAGYSINDTIVVFDRIRENLRRHTHDNFNELVGASLKQTLARSLNTTFTTILALLAIYFFGGESTKHFSLALIIGILSGAYSSIFIASPLLVTFGLRRAR